MKKATAALLAAVVFAGLSAPAGIAGADALQKIDAAVRDLSAFLKRSLPDREGQSLSVPPFLSDRGERVLLGDRLAAELELSLARLYRRTRVGPGGAGKAFTVSGELAPYPTQVRILCRLIAPDGSLAAGTRLDLALDPDLAALLVPPTQTEDYQGMGLPEVNPEAERDPLEPDNVSGAEVEVTSSSTPFQRYLSPGDIDRFRFYVAQAGPAVIEALTTIDAQLLLYREGERIPFEVRGNPSLSSIRLEIRLEPGYYVAELLAFDPDIEGDYSISFQSAAPASAPDAFEPDASPGEARPLAAGTRQQRTLAPGDQDWVELAAERPGFYALYTTGLAVDTVLTLFRDGRVQLAADDDGGAQNNAYLGFFQASGRLLARVTAKPPLDSGPYALAFEILEPVQIVPGSGVRELASRDSPQFLQLRILQAGKYLIRKQALQGPAQAELYSLPSMKALDAAGLVPLSVGDYLLVLKAAQGEAIRLCISAEAEAEACRKSVQE
jgi:hypothetical protein